MGGRMSPGASRGSVHDFLENVRNLRSPASITEVWINNRDRSLHDVARAPATHFEEGHRMRNIPVDASRCAPIISDLPIVVRDRVEARANIASSAGNGLIPSELLPAEAPRSPLRNPDTEPAPAQRHAGRPSASAATHSGDRVPATRFGHAAIIFRQDGLLGVMQL